tara:strand:+ start:176 stop:544 length:369 start_codon:yes stop_codon:yes gene_type:complete
MGNFWIIVGSISCATCVIIGAFGAHGLKDILNDYGKDIYEKGNLYHFFHSIGLIINGLLAKFFIDLNFNPSGYLFLIGIILFSISLYALAISNIKILGAITPIGGTCFIIAWLYIAFQIYNN